MPTIPADTEVPLLTQILAAIEAGGGGGGTPYDLGNISGNVTLDVADGASQKGAATGAVTILEPTGGSEGSSITVRITASGANRDLSFHADIQIPSDSAFTSPKTLTSGLTYTFKLIKGSTKWSLLSLIGGVTD